MGPGFWGPVGTPCDDGNFLTIGDTWGPGCICGGVGFDCLGVLGGTDWPGSPCDDADSTTINDMWSSQCQCLGDLSTGVGPVSFLASALTVWPNPVTDVVNINDPGTQASGALISIIDMNGRVVRSLVNVAAQDRTLTIPVADLPDGLYTLRIGDGLKAHHQRFVKLQVP